MGGMKVGVIILILLLFYSCDKHPSKKQVPSLIQIKGPYTCEKIFRQFGNSQNGMDSQMTKNAINYSVEVYNIFKQAIYLPLFNKKVLECSMIKSHDHKGWSTENPDYFDAENCKLLSGASKRFIFTMDKRDSICDSLELHFTYYYSDKGRPQSIILRMYKDRNNILYWKETKYNTLWFQG